MSFVILLGTNAQGPSDLKQTLKWLLEQLHTAVCKKISIPV